MLRSQECKQAEKRVDFGNLLGGDRTVVTRWVHLAFGAQATHLVQLSSTPKEAPHLLSGDIDMFFGTLPKESRHTVRLREGLIVVQAVSIRSGGNGWG